MYKSTVRKLIKKNFNQISQQVKGVINHDSQYKKKDMTTLFVKQICFFEENGAVKPSVNKYKC